MSGDILEKAPSGFEFADDPLDVGPQVSGVVRAFSLSRLGKRLAWVSGKQRVDAAPWSGVEGFDIIPDRGGVQVSGPLPGDDPLAGLILPFDVAGGGKARLGKAKTHVKSAAACAEGEAVSGR